MNLDNSIISQIQEYLSCPHEQAKNFAELITLREGLGEYFETYPEDVEDDRFKKQLEKVDRALEYKRSYRIALAARTGIGKSTLANAMLGRDLLLTKDVGEAATGTVLEIYQTADSTDEERAEVFYRNQNEVHNLIQEEFIDRFNLPQETVEKVLRGDLNQEVLNVIKDLPPPGDDDFLRSQESIIDIVEQYIEHGEELENLENKSETYLLNQDPNQQTLRDLIDENSQVNKGRTRKIGLIKKVSYHICPKQGEKSILRLPKNVCLIDLPGTDATSLHDTVIKKDIIEADAIVFLFHPRRINQRGDKEMIRSISKNIGITDPDQIFIVLNHLDTLADPKRVNEITRVVENFLDECLEDLDDLSYLPKRDGDNRFYTVSASVACLVNERLEGIESTGEEPPDYSRFCQDFEVEASKPERVLDKTNVPKVVEDLNTLARNNISKRIDEADINFRSMVEELRRMNHLKNSESPDFLQQNLADETRIQVQDNIQGRREKMKDDVEAFRKKQLEKRDELSKSLEPTIDSICESIDERLTTECPNLREKFFKEPRLRITASPVSYSLPLHFISEINFQLCNLLSVELKSLAQDIAKDYREAFKENAILENLLEVASNLPKISDFLNPEKVADITSTLEENLIQLSTRIAVTILLDPTKYLSPEEVQSEKNDQSEDSKNDQSEDPRDILLNKVKKFLTSIPDPDNSNNQSTELIAEMKRYYSQFVKVDIVQSLLNVYAYEMLLAEVSLFQSIDKLISYSLENPPINLQIDEEPEPVRILRETLTQAVRKKEKFDHLDKLRDNQQSDIS